MKSLLIGEANPYGSDPAFALYPSPPGCAGDRLCRLVMGLEPDDYLGRFDRVNLCPREWRTRDARERASAVLAEKRPSPTVLLGAKVCTAFGFDFEPFSVVYDATRVRLNDSDVAPAYVLLPHPSGLSRLWNAPDSYARARDILRATGVLS